LSHDYGIESAVQTDRHDRFCHADSYVSACQDKSQRHSQNPSAADRAVFHLVLLSTPSVAVRSLEVGGRYFDATRVTCGCYVGNELRA
jgi:hypothetical protein